MATATLTDTLRSAELDAMVAQLKDQRDRRADFIVPATALRAENGLIKVDGEDLTLNPTDVMLGTIGDSTRLDLPPRLLRDFHTGTKSVSVSLAYLDAFDAMVNGRLVAAREANRSFMIRTFTPGPDDGGVGVGRAMLSNKYGIIDNFDTIMSVLAGINEAGVPVVVQSCDLSETRMRVRFYSPVVQYMADEFLKGYRNPWGRDGEDLPVIFAGFEVANSETGQGAASVTPRFVIQICDNGMRITKDAMREIHTGARLLNGAIDFSADTHQANLELVAKMTRDSIAAFLDPEFLESRIKELEGEAATEIPAGAVSSTVEQVAKTQRFTNAESEDILSMFIAGGQLTAGGVMNAITAAAQNVPDPERAAFLEERAVPAMQQAARVPVAA